MDNVNQPMEETPQQESGTSGGLRITQSIRQNWRETTNWAMLFAVLGFIYLGFLLLILLFAGSELNTAGIPAIFMLLFAGGLIAPLVWFIFQYSRSVKNALRHEDTPSAETGFQNLRRLYQYTGILTIIVLGFYAIILLFGLMMLAMR